MNATSTNAAVADGIVLRPPTSNVNEPRPVLTTLNVSPSVAPVVLKVTVLLAVKVVAYNLILSLVPTVRVTSASPVAVMPLKKSSLFQWVDDVTVPLGFLITPSPPDAPL